jgi:starvation-inducible DNA-binding protein
MIAPPHPPRRIADADHDPYRAAMIPEIGLSDTERTQALQRLHPLLADELVLVQKLRDAHWNVTGLHFHALHGLFEEEYTALATVIDDIAERIRQLGGRPDASLGGALSLKRLQEFPNAGRNAEEYLRALLGDLETLVRQLRSDIPAVADVGTQDFLTGLIQQHEKSAWKLRASLTA